MSKRDLLWGRVGGTKLWDHKLRQLPTEHAHRVPVCHLGGMDRDPILGESNVESIIETSASTVFYYFCKIYYFF